MDELAKELNIKDREDWYKVSSTTLQQNGAYRLLVQKYNGSPSKLLQAVYSQYLHRFTVTTTSCQKYSWDITKFAQLPRGYWNDIANQRSFILDLAKKLNITAPESWYQITAGSIRQHGGAGLLSKYNGSLGALLRSMYPEYQWQRLIRWVNFIFYILVGCLVISNS